MNKNELKLIGLLLLVVTGLAPLSAVMAETQGSFEHIPPVPNSHVKTWLEVKYKKRLGPCPQEFVLSAFVQSDKPGRVFYRWEYTINGKRIIDTAPTSPLDFKKQNVKIIKRYLHVKKSSKNYVYRLRLLSPYPQATNTVSFQSNCVD